MALRLLVGLSPRLVIPVRLQVSIRWWATGCAYLESWKLDRDRVKLSVIQHLTYDYWKNGTQTSHSSITVNGQAHDILINHGRKPKCHHILFGYWS
jgi:hypothetical protein